MRKSSKFQASKLQRISKYQHPIDHAPDLGSNLPNGQICQLGDRGFKSSESGLTGFDWKAETETGLRVVDWRRDVIDIRKRSRRCALPPQSKVMRMTGRRTKWFD